MTSQSNRFLFLVCIFLFVLTACNRAKTSNKTTLAKAEQTSTPKVTGIWKRKGHSGRVVVFVHGIFGTPEDTWSCGSTSWPDLMLTDDKIDSDTDIYVARYETRTSGSAKQLDDAVDKLMGTLDGDGVLAHSEIDFVTHSLGGIVVKKLLLRHSELAEKTHFLYMLGTPQSGADLARLGSLFNANAFLKVMIPGDQHTYLLDLAEEWRRANYKHTHLYCAYEGKKIHGILVVPEVSATYQCDQSIEIKSKDHISLVKPCSKDDVAYLSVEQRLVHRQDRSPDAHPKKVSKRRSQQNA